MEGGKDMEVGGVRVGEMEGLKHMRKGDTQANP